MIKSIRTLKVSEYKGCKIYLRQYEGTYTFEYLAVINGEVYTMHMTNVPTWWQILLRRDYTERQMTDAVNYLQRYAETTVDHVLEKSK